MSIINDALQKADETKKTINPPLKGSRLTPVVLPSEKSKLVQYKWVFITGIIGVSVFVVITLILGERSIVRERQAATASGFVPERRAARDIPVEIIENKILPEEKNTLPDISRFRLAGVISGQGAPLAIINDSVYMVGDNLEGFQIKKITQNSVSLEKDSRTIELHVK